MEYVDRRGTPCGRRNPFTALLGEYGGPGSLISLTRWVSVAMTFTAPRTLLVDQTPHLIDVSDSGHGMESTWQAQGILMEVLGCDLAEATELIRLRSVIDRRTVIETARTIVVAGVA